MFENDDLDFYRESVNPENENQYKTPEGWQDFKVETKTIKVKNGEDIKLKVRFSNHGPIMNDVISTLKDKTPVAMHWMYTQYQIKTLKAMYTMSHANNIQEFQKGVSLIHAPGLNVMYGDADNNIAWWAAGKLYRFNEGVNPRFVLDGASGNDDPIKYLDFSKNPQAINPPWGYVYSANNQPDSIDGGYLYPGYYLLKDRAKCIVNLLEGIDKSSKNDFKMIPLYQDLDAEGLRNVRRHILQDVVRPIHTAEVIYHILINSDLAETEEFRESEIDEEMIASFSADLRLPIATKWLAEATGRSVVDQGLQGVLHNGLGQAARGVVGAGGAPLHPSGDVGAAGGDHHRMAVVIVADQASKG